MMTLALAAPLKQRLVDQLADQLAHATVFADHFISAWSLRGLSAIRSLPDKGELAHQIYRFVGDDPLSTFVNDELDGAFQGPGLNTDATERPLADYEGYRDLRAIAEELIESFATLPWSYQLTIELPRNLGAAVSGEFGDLDLSPRHRVVSGATLRAAFPKEEQHQGLAGLLIGAKPERSQWNDETAYLQVSMTGYFRSRLTEPFFSARDDVLTFFGLGIALGLLHDHPPDLGIPLERATHFYVHSLRNDAWVQQRSIDIDEQHQRGLARLVLANDIRDNPTIMREKLNRIGSIFRSDSGKSVALSARWLFDSHCGNDALLKYVQAAVAIEILLGDEEADPNLGLTTLMANRCAYLIAKTPGARTNLLKMFRDIYRVRSKIVHRGKSRLNAQEVRLFHALQMITRMLIDNEQRLLERAEQRRDP